MSVRYKWNQIVTKEQIDALPETLVFKPVGANQSFMCPENVKNFKFKERKFC